MVFQCTTLPERLNQKSPNSIFLMLGKDRSAWDAQRNTFPLFKLWSDKECNIVTGEEGIYSCDPALESLFMSLAQGEILTNVGRGVFQFVDAVDLTQISQLQPNVRLFIDKSYESSLSGMESVSSKGKVWSLTKDRMDQLLTESKNQFRLTLERMRLDRNHTETESSFRSKYHPFFLKDESVRKEAIRFITHFEPSDLACQMFVREPQGATFVTTGYDEGLTGKVSCNPSGTIPLFVHIEGNEFVRLSSTGDTTDSFSILTNQDFEFQVYSLSMNAQFNLLKVSAEFMYPKERSLLRQELGITSEKKVTMETASIALLNTPSEFNAEYARYADVASQFSDTYPLGSLQNGQIQTTMLSNGAFSFGGSRAGVPFDLVFGHPNGVYADSIWSSYTNVKVDDQVFELRKFPSDVIEVSQDRIEVVHRLDVASIEVFSSLVKDKGNKDSFRLSFKIINKGSQTKKVGVLLFLDTWAGSTDGVPFSLGFQTAKDRVITNEYKFNPTLSPFWETNDISNGGGNQVFLQNKMIGASLVPPDEIAFVSWGSGYGMDWDYVVSENRSVTGDSAVYLRWNQKPIQAGKQLDVSTQFSSIDRTKELDLVLSDPIIGNGIFSAFKEYNEVASVTYEFVSDNGSITTPNGSTSVTFQTDSSESSKQVFQVPVVFNGAGLMKVKVVETIGQIRKEYPFEIQLPDTDRVSQPTLLEPQKKIPVQFFTKESNRKIQAKFVEEGTLRVLDSQELKEEKTSSGSIYKGELVPPSGFSGQGLVQYFDLGQNPLPPIRQTPKDTTLLANQVEITLASGKKVLGDLVDQDTESIKVKVEGKQETIHKRDVTRVRYGR